MLRLRAVGVRALEDQLVLLALLVLGARGLQGRRGVTLLLWGIACVLWAIALYGLCRVPSKTPPPPPEHVSREWLAQFRRNREE